MKKIVLYDPTYVTDNLGDQIIMESVQKYLREIFPEGYFTGIPTHDYPGPVAFECLKQSDYAFVGGTNILASHLLWYRQWKLRITDLHRAGKPVLMGVGWHKYQTDPDIFSRMIYKKLLHDKFLHSVRDLYTYEKLKGAGIGNIIYTGCPTMWRLTPDHVATVKNHRSPNVVLTLTAYRRNAELDAKLVTLLKENYEKVYFWPQMYDDLAYLKEITSTDKLEIIEPSVAGVRKVFLENDVDYVGLRLHCGVLALQNKVRTLILEVDNRATEISRNTKLPTAARDQFDMIRDWIVNPKGLELNIPVENIEKWKSQFTSK